MAWHEVTNGLPFELRGIARPYDRVFVVARINAREVDSAAYKLGNAKDRHELAVRWSESEDLRADRNAGALADDIEAVLKRLETGILRAEDGDGELRADWAAAAGIKSEAVKWLWHERIPAGMLTVLIGDPGVGKSLLTIDLAARVSRGVPLPGDPPAGMVAGDVLLLSAEDSPEHVIRPRLEVAGADLRRVHILRGMQTTGGKDCGPFTLERDLHHLADKATTTKPLLIVIDPLTAYCGKTDTHQNSQVRGLLAPLAELADRTGAAIVAVTHLTKGDGTKAIYRAMGSLAFTAAARCVHLVTDDQDDEPAPGEAPRKLLLMAKSNVGRRPAGLSYRIADGPRIDWDPEPINVSADDALGAKPGPKPTERERVENWLREFLADGRARESTEVLDEAQRLGFNEKTLQRARTEIGVISWREGIAWRCRLPKPGNNGSEG